MSEHIETLMMILRGVEMDLHCLDDGQARIDALDAAITALRTPQPVTPAGGEVVATAWWDGENPYPVADRELAEKLGYTIPLYDHPPVADAALVRDAERYRWLRDRFDPSVHGDDVLWLTADAFDRDIDLMREADQDAEWQTIDTAPKDGTEIWAGAAGVYGFPVYPLTCRYACGMWVANFGDNQWDRFEPQPTHWKAIAAAPKLAGEE